MQRPPGVGPVALEPPAAGVDAERDAGRRGRPRAATPRPVGVGELRAPRGGGLAHGHRFVEAARRAPAATDVELVDEPRAHRRLVGVGVGAREHDPAPRAREDHAEEPALVVEPLAVALDRS